MADTRVKPSPEKLKRLDKLLDEGLPTQIICERLGMCRDSVNDFKRLKKEKENGQTSGIQQRKAEKTL